jgi:hypothetical protein
MPVIQTVSSTLSCIAYCRPVTSETAASTQTSAQPAANACQQRALDPLSRCSWTEHGTGEALRACTTRGR